MYNNLRKLQPTLDLIGVGLKTPGPLRENIPTRGLIGAWDLNGNANGLFGVNGNPINIVWSNTDIGYQAQCGSFSGNSYINLPNVSDIDLSSNNWCLFFNIKPNISSGDRGIIGKRTSFGNLNWQIWKQSANRLVMGIGNSLGGGVIDWGYTFTLNKNVSCLIIRNGTNFSLYIDGEFISTVTNSSTISNTLIPTIGRLGQDVTTNQWSGNIQNIIFYNIILTHKEIKQLSYYGKRLLH